jgi:hypothetical protein
VAAGLFEERTIGMGEEDDRLFLVVDAIVREVWLIVGDERDDVGAWDVSGSDDREFVPGDAAAVMNSFDEAARDVAANGHSMKHARKEEIVNVTRLSRDLGATFLPDNRSADGHAGILVPPAHHFRHSLYRGPNPSRYPSLNPAR